MMVICHETASGQRNTLELPRIAALNHLIRHPLDTVGPCEPIIPPTTDNTADVLEPKSDEIVKTKVVKKALKDK